MLSGCISAFRSVARDPAESAWRLALVIVMQYAEGLTERQAADAVGDVDKRRKGIFLFNYFVGEDPQVTLALWDYLAGWYAVETEMDNSTLLLPLEGEPSDYSIINYARWDGLLSFMWRQFTKESFRTYMQANLDANHVGAMPILYHLA